MISLCESFVAALAISDYAHKCLHRGCAFAEAFWPSAAWRALNNKRTG